MRGRDHGLHERDVVLRGIGPPAPGPSGGLPPARRVSVGVVLDLDHADVVQKSVHRRRGDQVVEEERVPVFQSPVGGDDHRVALVARLDDLGPDRDRVGRAAHPTWVCSLFKARSRRPRRSARGRRGAPVPASRPPAPSAWQEEGVGPRARPSSKSSIDRRRVVWCTRTLGTSSSHRGRARRSSWMSTDFLAARRLEPT